MPNPAEPVAENSLREEAEYLRVTLAMGLIDGGVVVSWADRIIAALDEPPIQVIDVSLAGSKPVTEIMSLLKAVPGHADLVAAAHRALGLFLQRFRAGCLPLERAVKMLWTYSQSAVIPDNERVQAGNFEDSLLCAQQGHHCTAEDVRADIEKFLVAHWAGAAPP